MTETHVHRFDADTTLTALDEGRFATEIGAGWSSIGGAPNGGYTLALTLAAASQALPDTEPLSAAAHYLKPASVGAAEVVVEVVKRGRFTSTVQAALFQQGSERLRVLATYGDRAAIGWPNEYAPAPPELPGPDDCIAPPVLPGSEATIAERFDYRVTPTTRWVSGTPSGTPRIEGWIRFSDGREPDPTALPLFVDAFAPAVYEIVDAALVPTLDLTIHFRQRPAPGWLQARFTSRALIGGTVDEDGELWDSDGNLVAMSRQSALVRPFG